MAEHHKISQRVASKANVRFPLPRAVNTTSNRGDFERPLVFGFPLNTCLYWREVFKAKYQMTEKVPKKPAFKSHQQEVGWRRFCQWVKFHKPPFPKDHIKLVLEGAKSTRSDTNFSFND